MESTTTTDMEDVDTDESEFTLAEIRELENVFRGMDEESLTEEFCRDLAAKLGRSPYRIGKPAIKWQQVQSWYIDKQNQQVFTAALSPIDEDEVDDDSIPAYATECSKKPEAVRIAELSELIFEAKSAKDEAWFDVGSFLNYRVLSTGQLEVRVRFSGFNNAEDEWVSVRRAVRERSIPLEPSECWKVNVGDLVLCFRECEDHALYSDARVVDVERRLHDMEGCQCVFLVRYDYDNVEEKVELGRLCCRPT